MKRYKYRFMNKVYTRGQIDILDRIKAEIETRCIGHYLYDAGIASALKVIDKNKIILLGEYDNE